MRDFLRETKKTVYEVSEIVCNSCGEIEQVTSEHFVSLMQEIKIGFGYGSRFDGQIWHFDLCEKCLQSFALAFKVPVESENQW